MFQLTDVSSWRAVGFPQAPHSLHAQAALRERVEIVHKLSRRIIWVYIEVNEAVVETEELVTGLSEDSLICYQHLTWAAILGAVTCL